MTYRNNLDTNIRMKENIDCFFGDVQNMFSKNLVRAFFFCLLALFFFGGLFNHNVDAAVYYVSPSGSDSNAGTTPSSPWATATKAFRSVQPGDTVHFAVGIYTDKHADSVVNGTESLPITFVGDGTAYGAIIDGDWTINNSWYVIKGFHFRNGIGTNGNLYLKGPNANHNIIDSNKFTSFHVGIYFTINGAANDHGRGDTSYNIISNNDFSENRIDGAALVIIGTGNVVEKNTFHNNNGHDALHIWGDRTIIRENLFDHMYTGPEADPPNNDHADIIQTFNTTAGLVATNIVFERNKIIGCSNQFGNLTTIDGSDLISTWTFKNNLFVNSRTQINIYIPHVSFYNNTIVGNKSSNGFRFAYDPDWGKGNGDYGKVFNNIFIRCNGYYSFNPGNPHCKADYNLYTSSTDGPDPHGLFSESHGINGGYAPNQVFVDPENNFRLVSGSPAISAGIPVDAVTRDIELNDRAIKSDFDMGAYMFISQPVLPSAPKNFRE